MDEVIEIDLGDDVVHLKLDSVERWSWSDRSAASTACSDCKGTGRVTCGECDGCGFVECNLGHEHECDECDEDGKWECGACENGFAIDDEAIVEIVMRWHAAWQCDVTTHEGRVGSSIARDTPQDAFEAAAIDATWVQKRRNVRRAA